MKQSTQKTLLTLALAGLLGGGAMLLAPSGPDSWPLIAAAQAAEDGHGDGHSGGGHSSGGQGGGHSGLPRGHSGGHDSGGDSGHDHEDGGDDGHDDGGDSHSDHGGKKGGSKHGKGGAGHDGESNATSGRGGRHSVDNRIFGGGRPVWAREGIPEVELGRLNVSRAPGHVLMRAEDEALAGYSASMAQLYNLSAEDAAALLRTDFRGVARYDSPLQNLALYKDVMVFGKSELPGVDNDQLDLAAIFLGSASDKTIPISEDTVVAINRILGLVDLNDQDRATLAGKAETVRSAILVGHGETDSH